MTEHRQNSINWEELADDLRTVATKAESHGYPEAAQAIRKLADEGVGAGYGARLRAARERANLSQQQAARLAKVSVQTYRNAEVGYRPPSAKTLAAFDKVPQLRLSAETTEPQWWHSQNFDPVGLFRGLRETLSLDKGHLDPAHLYLDPAGAESYSVITHTRSYEAQTRNPCPIDDAAVTVTQELGSRFDAVLLGSGDGSTESRFVRLLPTPGAIIAVDISQVLLSAAYTRLVDDFPSSRVFALQGDITQLREHRQLAYRGYNVPVLVTMFGKTFSNLGDERSFLDGLGVFQPGAIFVFDVNLARGTTESEVRRNDEALIRGVPESYSDFLSGPLSRYLRGYETAKLTYELSMLSIKGAYSLDCWADVKMFDGTKRRFRVAQFKRYSLDTLTPLFARYGWTHVATHGYVGQEDKAALLVFKRAE